MSVRQRTHLERIDFDRLRDAGLLRLIACRGDVGGTFESFEGSECTICEHYRSLAAGDASVALVSAMHPSVIAFWLATEDPAQPDWEEQRRCRVRQCGSRRTVGDDHF